MDLVFERKPFTDWKVIIEDRDNNNEEPTENNDGFVGTSWNFNEFYGNFRVGNCKDDNLDEEDKIVFTLGPRNGERALLWVKIRNNNNKIESVSFIPAEIKVDKRKKEIRILPMVYCIISPDEKTLKLINTYLTGLDILIRDPGKRELEDIKYGPNRMFLQYKKS